MADSEQRDALTSPVLCPPWLCGYNTNGQRYMYLVGLALDMLLEKQNEAQLAKCPGHGDPSVLPLQAADRLLTQGPAENDSAFILRLENAFNSWARAGSRPAVLGQLQAYLTNSQPNVTTTKPELLIVGGNTTYTTWDSLTFAAAQDAAPAHRTITPANWDWDGLDRPTRAWLVLFEHLVASTQTGTAMTVSSVGGSGVSGVTAGFATLTGLSGLTASNAQQYLVVTGAASSANNGTFQIVYVSSATSCVIANTAAVAPDANNGAISWTISDYQYIGPAPVWGSQGANWGTANTWGVDCSTFVIQSVRQILSRWKAASTYYPNIIVSFGGGDATAGNEFSPQSSEGAGNPDGTWGGIGRLVAGVWVPAKTPVNHFTSFCDGTGLAINCYEICFT